MCRWPEKANPALSRNRMKECVRVYRGGGGGGYHVAPCVGLLVHCLSLSVAQPDLFFFFDLFTSTVFHLPSPAIPPNKVSFAV